MDTSMTVAATLANGLIRALLGHAGAGAARMGR
jgi:hypothetical protein